MVKRRIVAEDTMLSREERRHSDEEISYGEIVNDFLVDFIPWRGAFMKNILIAAMFFVLVLLFWFMCGNEFVQMTVLEKDDVEILYKVGDRYSSAPPHPLKRNLVDDVWQNVMEQQKPCFLWDKNLYTGFIVALNQQEWIQKVVEIRKTYPPHMQILVEYRVPAMMVYSPKEKDVPEGGGDIIGIAVPVAEDAVVLPFRDFPQDVREEYPVLRDIRELPDGLQSGQDWKNRLIVWNDDRVRQALKIVRVIGPYWKKMGLKYINVHEIGVETFQNGKPFELKIETANGSIIQWRDISTNNITDEQKAQALVKFYEEHNGLDSPGKKMNFNFKINAPEASGTF